MLAARASRVDADGETLTAPSATEAEARGKALPATGAAAAPPSGPTGAVPRSRAGFPPQRLRGSISSPFMRKESASRTAPWPIVTP